MVEISADYADYADYVCGSDVIREDQQTNPANMSLFVVACGATSNRNLCNLRIFNLGLPSADRC
jgi:hypothetical protein